MQGMLVAACAILCFASTAGARTAACPRPALARLVQLVGNWSVAWEWRANDTLVAISDAHASVSSAAAGCSLVERLEGRRGASPIALSTMIAAPTADSLELAYVDSDHGSLLIFAGSVRDDTIRFTWSKDLGTRTLLVRREYSGITPGAFATHTFMSPDGGQTWILVQRAHYERIRP